MHLGAFFLDPDSKSGFRRPKCRSSNRSECMGGLSVSATRPQITIRRGGVIMITQVADWLRSPASSTSFSRYAPGASSRWRANDASTASAVTLGLLSMSPPTPDAKRRSCGGAIARPSSPHTAASAPRSLRRTAAESCRASRLRRKARCPARPPPSSAGRQLSVCQPAVDRLNRSTSILLPVAFCPAGCHRSSLDKVCNRSLVACPRKIPSTRWPQDSSACRFSAS